jgi:pimeloyl-ACP methyl ester carboxylesterase
METTQPVLLLHGYMDVAASWEEVAPELAQAGFRVIAPDLRGFGDAPRAAIGSYYYFSDYIADVAALGDALAQGRALYIVGHSMGGTVATLFAGAFPERVAKLALLEGLGPPGSTFDDAPFRLREFVEGSQRHRASSERSMSTLDEVAKRLAMSHPKVDPAILRARVPSLVRERPDGRYVWRFDPLHRARSPFPFYAGAYRACAARVACPVLAVSGGPDGYHPSDEAERISAFRDVRVHEIAAAGHMMHWTRPAELSALLVEFLLSPGSSSPSPRAP